MKSRIDGLTLDTSVPTLIVFTSLPFLLFFGGGGQSYLSTNWLFHNLMMAASCSTREKTVVLNNDAAAAAEANVLMKMDLTNKVSNSATWS